MSGCSVSPSVRGQSVRQGVLTWDDSRSDRQQDGRRCNDGFACVNFCRLSCELLRRLMTRTKLIVSMADSSTRLSPGYNPLEIAWAFHAWQPMSSGKRASGGESEVQDVHKALKADQTLRLQSLAGLASPARLHRRRPHHLLHDLHEHQILYQRPAGSLLCRPTALSTTHQ